jgi:hypothetical protein
MKPRGNKVFDIGHGDGTLLLSLHCAFKQNTFDQFAGIDTDAVITRAIRQIRDDEEGGWMPQNKSIFHYC